MYVVEKFSSDYANGRNKQILGDGYYVISR